MPQRSPETTLPDGASLLAALAPFRALALTFSQAMILIYLDGAIPGRTSVRDLSSKLQLAKPNVTRSADGLIEMGLLHRRAHHSDKRVVIMSLTAEGAALVYQVKQAAGKRPTHECVGYWVSTSPAGRRRWWPGRDRVPQDHIDIRPATPSEAELMSRIEKWQDEHPPARLVKQLHSLMKKAESWAQGADVGGLRLAGQRQGTTETRP